MLRLDLCPLDEPGVLRISMAEGVASACARLDAAFLGGGDGSIITRLNSTFLLAALKALDGERVVIDVEQNAPSTHKGVVHRPLLLSGEDHACLKWVLMPVFVGLEANAASLGSNLPANVANEECDFEAEAVVAADA